MNDIRLSVRHVASLHLGPSAPLVEVGGGLLLSGIAGFDVVDHRSGAGSFSHARRRALVLDDVRIAIPIRDSALDPDGEPISADLGGGELCPNRLLNLLILLSGSALRGRSLGRWGRFDGLAPQGRCQK